MSVESRTISRRRLEPAEIRTTNLEPAQAFLEVSERPQEQANEDDAGWLRSAMVAQYSLCTQLAAELNAQDPSHLMTARATHFLESSNASRYIDETIAELEMNPSPYDTVEVLSARVVTLRGDKASAYAYTYAMSDYVASSGIAVLIQEGSAVYEFEVEGTEAPEMATVNAVIEEILDCVQEGSERKEASTFSRH